MQTYKGMHTNELLIPTAESIGLHEGVHASKFLKSRKIRFYKLDFQV